MSSANEFRQLALKSMNVKRDQLKSTFEALLAEARPEAEAGRFVKVYDGMWDPLVVEMFEKQGFRVETYNDEKPNCTLCSMLHHRGKLVCDTCRDSDCLKTKLTWGAGLGGDQAPQDESAQPPSPPPSPPPPCRHQPPAPQLPRVGGGVANLPRVDNYQRTSAGVLM
jgi:hypothetical protein